MEITDRTLIDNIKGLTDREKLECSLALDYTEVYNGYGTDGHGRLVLIAKLVKLLLLKEKE